MSHLDVTFFVDQDSERNQERYVNLIDEQYKIAYISQGAISFHDVGALSFEDRTILVDIIKEIKQKEKQQLEGNSNTSTGGPPLANPFPESLKARFSSANPIYSSGHLKK